MASSESRQKAVHSTTAKKPSNKKVLVVDDEQDIRLILRMVLEKYNFQVLEAENGKKALDVLKQDIDGIFCVVTDYLMPQMNGLQLCKQIRETMKYSGGIFLITAYLDKEQFDKAICFDEKFMKPLDFEVLVKKLKEQMKN